MAKTKVGVMRGGPSSEYDISLMSGASVLKNLPDKYHPIDVFIDKEGTWHIDGLPHSPEQVFQKTDVIFNAMHGEYGEDGKVQRILESHSFPYTGSTAFPSAMAMNKAMAKNMFSHHGLKTPRHRLIKIRNEEEIEEIALDLFRNFGIPVIIKPVGAGSSVGVHLAKDFLSLLGALVEVSRHFRELLIEEYITGREATVGVIDHFRGQAVYVLPAVEIRPPKDRSFFDREVKYNGTTEEICPGNFSESEKEELHNLAAKAHQALGLRHYSRSDFIVNPKRGIYILETNTLPGLTTESLFPKSLKAVGSNLPEFLDHVITLAIEEK